MFRIQHFCVAMINPNDIVIKLIDERSIIEKFTLEIKKRSILRKIKTLANDCAVYHVEN